MEGTEQDLFLQDGSHQEDFENSPPFLLHKIFGKIELFLNGTKKVIKQGEMITILPNQTHLFRDISGSGSVIEELSTQSFKKDSYYLDESITKNKNRKSFISLIN